MTTTRKPRQPKVSVEDLNVMKAYIESLELKLKEAEDRASRPTESGGLKQDSYVRVVSLINYPLNLSTKEFGQGEVKKFTHFGETKKILYRDLVDILEAYRHFQERGYFYILDPEVVRQHGLDDIYANILTKESIEKILQTNSDECVALYKLANPGQQEIIIDLLVEKLRADRNAVNLNVIDQLSRISKVDIVKRADETIELDKVTE